MLEARTRACPTDDLLTFDRVDHLLDDTDACAEMLTKIGQLLDQTIGHWLSKKGGWAHVPPP